MKRQILSLQEERQEKLIIEAYQIFRRVKVNNNLSDRTIKHYDGIIELLGKFFGDISKIYCSDINVNDGDKMNINGGQILQFNDE